MNHHLGSFSHDNNFINQALKIHTELLPLEILDACLSIEQQLGRTRTYSDNYQARTIDIDILLFNSEIVSEKKSYSTCICITDALLYYL